MFPAHNLTLCAVWAIKAASVGDIEFDGGGSKPTKSGKARRIIIASIEETGRCCKGRILILDERFPA
jgi:hypothetical protein